MKSGLEALKELQMASTSSHTKGFRSHALADGRVQEAAIRNGKDIEAMVHIANRETRRGSVSKKKH